MIGSIFRGIGRGLSSVRAAGALAVAFALGLVVLGPSAAMAQLTLDTANFDVNITDYVAVTASTFATLVAAVLGVLFLIMIVRSGIRWIRSYAAR